MHARNVLRVNGVEETASYRRAVAQIILNIQNVSSQTYLEIAECIDVSVGTISNAANKKTDLNAIYLHRLQLCYGAHTLDPLLALSGARGVPLDARTERDVLPFIARANLKITEARDPASPGGVREIHTERLGYLPDLLALQAELSGLICSIQAEAA